MFEDRSIKFRGRGFRPGWRAVFTLAVVISLGSASLLVSDGGAANAPGVSKATLHALRAKIAAASRVPKFVAPGPAVDGSAAKGDTVVVIPLTSAASQCVGQLGYMAKAGDSLGITTKIISDDGTVTEYNQGISEAITEHANAIVLGCGIVPGSVSAELSQAKADGIKVVDSTLNDISIPTPSSIDGSTGAQTNEGADLNVDSAIVNGNGKAIQALLVASSDIAPSASILKAEKAEFAKECPKCKYKEINIPVADYGTTLQSSVSEALVANPNITAVITPFDSGIINILPAVLQAHRSGLKIYTQFAAPNVVKEITTSKGVVDDEWGASQEWTGYVIMDQVLRLLLNEPAIPNDKEYAPSRLWTLSNAKKFFTSSAYGTSFITGFQKLWGES